MNGGEEENVWPQKDRRRGVTITREEYRVMQVGGLVLVVIVLWGFVKECATESWRKNESSVETLDKRLDTAERWFQAETARIDREKAVLQKEVEHFGREIAEARSAVNEATKGINEIRNAHERMGAKLK